MSSQVRMIVKSSLEFGNHTLTKIHVTYLIVMDQLTDFGFGTSLRNHTYPQMAAGYSE